MQWGKLLAPGDVRMFGQLVGPFVDPVAKAVSGGLADSEFARQTPELVGVVLVAGLVLTGVWRILSKVQEGHGQTVTQFLAHIEKAAEKHEELAESARQALEGNRATLEKVQASMDRNTEMLGRAAVSIERSNEMIERLEKTVISNSKQGRQ